MSCGSRAPGGAGLLAPARGHRPVFTRGWLRTGDVARVDEEGFIYIVDRAKDVIIRGGENVYSVEIEDALYEHPAVSDCAVMGVPEPTLGEEVGAVVVLRHGTQATAEELADHVRSHLAGFKVPTRFWFPTSRCPATPPARCSSGRCGPSSSGTRPRPTAPRPQLRGPHRECRRGARAPGVKEWIPKEDPEGRFSVTRPDLPRRSVAPGSTTP